MLLAILSGRGRRVHNVDWRGKRDHYLREVRKVVVCITRETTFIYYCCSENEQPTAHHHVVCQRVACCLLVKMMKLSDQPSTMMVQ